MTYADDIIAGKYKIPISWLHTQAYCEYQIFLEHVKGISVDRSIAMIVGAESHAKLDAEHAAKVEEIMSLEEVLVQSTERKVTFVAREVGVENLYLKGIIDEIRISPAEIIIIDDKPTKGKAWPADIRQVWGYCWAYSDQYKPDRTLYGAVRDRETQEFVWQEPFTENAKKDVKEATFRIIDILKGVRAAVPTRKPQKCKPCRFRKVCDKCLST
ncbi:MAG: PD-(D/E)XK nuclease family protein [Candidatus Nanoarchaeia archaeon]